MLKNHSICLYHNGNRQIVDYYQKKLSHLEFSGNWVDITDPDSHGKLWEICYADVSRENLIKANTLGIHVLRHVSTYNNDQRNLLPECAPMEFEQWLNYVVCNNLIFCDEVVSELEFENLPLDQTIIITPGRTANAHFRKFLKSLGQHAIECSKSIDNSLLNSQSAVLMWRENHWESLSSNWLALQTNQWIHQINQHFTEPINIDHCVKEISQEWIDNDWKNLCQLVFDCACFFKLILRRPVSLMTTERAMTELQSSHSKINYDKSKLINNYNQTKNLYQSSNTHKLVDSMYNRITALIPTWKIDNENNTI